MKLENWKSPYCHYYRVLGEAGNVRLETINQQEALDFISSKYEKEKILLMMEQVKR